MIDKKLEAAINKQINFEMYSAYLYMSMSAFFTSKNLKGAANWTHIQAQEEMVHAMKFYYYLLDRGGKVTLEAIAKPEDTWKNALAVFKDVSKHEGIVTSRINDIADLAASVKDHATSSMIKWFIDEQVEEEANAEEIVRQLEMVGNDSSGLFMIDKELAARVFAMPAGAMIKGLGAAAAP